MTNHAPDKTDPTPVQYGPNCPETETLDIWAGFAHGGEKPCERNFETIPTGHTIGTNTFFMAKVPTDAPQNPSYARSIDTLRLIYADGYWSFLY